MSEWREVALGDVIELKRGYDLPKRARADGPFPIVSSSGISGSHGEAKVRGPGVVTGRYGTLGQVFYVAEDFWPLNTALYVRDFKGNNARFVALLLESMDLAQHDGAAAVPGLNRNQLHTVPVYVPERSTQDRIASIVEALDDLIENNRRRVEVLEEMARAIYREWFVRFRYPGHEDVSLVDSALGPIPDGWAVKRVADLGTTGAGPFGSKLGRKDYVADGVPVLRGANLRVGGGFDESDFVYVTSEKAEELRSSTASRGDVLITQRGTLGQIALIPETSDHERYVLSQSQMKLTVNTDAASAEFVYRQMSTAEVTARFIAQAMSSGVPHVNLTVLREFEILAPPHDLQYRFGDTVRGLDQEASALRAQARTLGGLRDLLLPKLVTGQLDLSHLDLDALAEAATA